MNEDEKKRHEMMESLCRHCGLCCQQKVRAGDVVIISDVPCEFLDPATNMCTVYPERFIRQPLCCNIDVAIANNAQPNECPYVGGNSKYDAPLLISEHPEYREGIEELFSKKEIGGKKKR